MKPTATLVLAALSAIAWGCDEGRIYDDYEFEGPEGLVARVTATVTGADQWPEGYALAVAGFADGSEYALISKNAEAGPDGSCDVVLTGIPREVTSVELCAIDRLRRRVGTFAKAECSEKADTIRLSAGNVDASPAAAIQTEIFNTTCTQCSPPHASTSPRATRSPTSSAWSPSRNRAACASNLATAPRAYSTASCPQMNQPAGTMTTRLKSWPQKNST